MVITFLYLLHFKQFIITYSLKISVKTSLSQSYKGGSPCLVRLYGWPRCLKIIFFFFTICIVYLQILYKMILDRIYFYLLTYYEGL